MKIRSASQARNNAARTWASALVLALALAFTLTLPAAPSMAVDTVAFQPPNLEQFIRGGEGNADGDGDGVEESQVQRYRNLSGDRVFSLTTKERLWAWSLDSEGGDADISRNFVIRDSDCDGVFDQRYGLDEEFHLPECVK